MQQAYKSINSIDEINYADGDNITFLATVISIIDNGDNQTRPIKAVLKLERSGENVNISTWKFDILDQLKLLCSLDSVYEFTGKATLYKDKDKQIKIETIRDAQMRSARKVIKSVNIPTIKGEINTIIETYIKNPTYKLFLRTLIQENEKFYQWPAATKIHHAYEGGLAKHSLGVCKNALAVWKNYEGSNMDVELIVAGALLHDIGKIQEYNKDGSRTTYGNLLGHPVIGSDKIFKVAIENNIDPEKDLRVLMLRNVILSHHEKLEFGSPVTPGTLEACIVAQSDMVDASFEMEDSSLDMIELYGSTAPIKFLENKQLFKWHN